MTSLGNQRKLTLDPNSLLITSLSPRMLKLSILFCKKKIILERFVVLTDCKHLNLAPILRANSLNILSPSRSKYILTLFTYSIPIYLSVVISFTLISKILTSTSFLKDLLEFFIYLVRVMISLTLTSMILNFLMVSLPSSPPNYYIMIITLA